MKSEFLQQLNEEILKLVKEKMEALMEAEREAYTKEHGVRKNGFYERNLLTKWGKQGSQDKGRGLLPKPIKALLQKLALGGHPP